MRLVGLLAATALVATCKAAFPQGGANTEGDVNARGTIGPTVTARPPVSGGTTATNADRDAGRYGVPGGVGDPSIGLSLTRGFHSAPARLDRSSRRTRR